MIIENGHWCVYIHISPSNKYYVGITSQKPERRWQNGYGYQTGIMKKAIRKYGWDNFQHIIVANNLTELEAKNFEMLLIEKLHSNNPKFGYNISAGGEGNKGLVHSDLTKKKISESKKEYYKTHESTKCRPVYQFDCSGNLIEEYKSVFDAERKTGINHSNISGVCNGKLLLAHGYFWAHKDSVDNLELIKKYIISQMKTRCNKYGKHSMKPVNLYDLAGNFIAEFDSMSKLAEYLDIPKTTLSRSCRNGNIICRQFRCRYI